MSKKIYLTFVGQLREFDQAVFSHVGFIERLKSAVNYDPSLPVELYVSIVTWDESYSVFPKHVETFIKREISKEYVLAVIGEMISPFVVDTTVIVVPKIEAKQVLLDSGINNIVDDFHSVSYLHEKSLDAMLDFERKGNFKFDTIILTRPDLFLQMINIEGGVINDLSDTTVYYKNARKLLVRNTLTPSNDINTQASYEQYVDQFNIFGRTAFYAYGLMFRYIIANKDNDQFFYTPSLHFWVDRYLEKFRIAKSELIGIDLRYAIIRPTHRMTHPGLDFSMGDAKILAE
jgi:hypothetical protein